MQQRFLMLLVAMIATTGASGAPLSDQLAQLGHPDTKFCTIQKSRQGMGQLLVLQFRPKSDVERDKAESIALLNLLVNALNTSGRRYVGFNATEYWETCSNRNPELVYWRDYEDNWRLMREAPLKYLRHTAANLPAKASGTYVEAYVLFSLGLVEQRLNRTAISVGRFERAYEILKDSHDPNGILRFLLLPLIHHHLGREGGEPMGDFYLFEYARVTQEQGLAGQTPYLPLIKIAPDYPFAALRHGHEGYAIVEFTVGVDGRVLNPVVVEESKRGKFGAAAVAAARKFRYVPAIANGKRVASPGVRNKITFEIQ